MKIHIDVREKYLINEIENDPIFNHELIKKQLDLGDIIIYDNEDNIKLLIERKTISDLTSSIKDGRYNEQSLRLNSFDIHNHNIIYLIEGNFNFNKDINMIYSAMISLLYHKGFSIWQSDNVQSTKDIIKRMASKIEKELPKKQSFYSLDNNVNNKEYIDCIKLSKKENITKDNIHEIMLSQIPNVSTSLARIILQKHNNIFQLKESLELDKDCLNSIKYVMSNGKERKISSLAINSIKNLLV
jgi:ERCC4-type nuclease